MITNSHRNGFPAFPQQSVLPDLSKLIPGDYYPERNVFHILIAICSGPRFALILLWYLLTCSFGPKMPRIMLFVGILRTFLFGVFAYVSSTESFIVHEIAGLGYILCTLPWTMSIISVAPKSPRTRKYRKIFAGCLFATLIPMIYFYIQHRRKVSGSIH